MGGFSFLKPNSNNKQTNGSKSRKVFAGVGAGNGGKDRRGPKKTTVSSSTSASSSVPLSNHRLNTSNLMMRPDMHYSTSSSSESDPEEQILPSERRRVRKIRSTFNTHHQLTAAENRYPTTAPTLNPVISGDPYANHIYSQTTVARDRLNQSLDPRAFGSIHNMSVLCQGNSLRGNCSMYGSVNGGVCYDNGHRNLAMHCQRLKKESEKLFEENRKLRNDIETLFRELQLTTEIVYRCSNHIPHLITLLFNSSIGQKTLSHVNIPTSTSHEHMSQQQESSSSSSTTPSVPINKQLQLKPLAKLSSPQILKQRNSQCLNESISNIEQLLKETEARFETETKSKSVKKLKRSPKQELEEDDCSSIYENLDFISEVLQNRSNSTSACQNFPCYGRNANEEPLDMNKTVPCEQNIAPFFEDETEKALEKLNLTSNEIILNETFSEADNSHESSSKEIGRVNRTYVEQESGNSYQQYEQNKPAGSYAPRELSVDISKATLERVKADFISSFRQQIRRSKQNSRSNGALNINTTLQNCDTSFTSTSSQSVSVKITRRNRKLSNNLSRSQNNVENLDNTNSISDLLDYSKKFSRKLIHLQSEASVFPEKLQHLLKKEPLVQLIKVLNELEAVIKVHVNSIYLQYLL
ncbi:uncharacterized protein LOC142334952 [Convolutriloba macropyga]|uniref:uncharacterized protein LOC142334952 n=1 Tax=Convolutriloba macropyga TaxID=536237 RepID=UPI003F51EECD